MSVSKVSAGILQGMLFYGRLVGLVFFKYRNKKDGSLEESEEVFFLDGPLFKWLKTILRLLCFCCYIYLYAAYATHLEIYSSKYLHCLRLMVSVSCFLGVLRLQIFKEKEVIQLVNRFIKLFRKVRALSQKKSYGFGGERELILILLLFGSNFEEFFLLFGFIINPANKLAWICDIYIYMICNTILSINVLWYLGLGVFYSELNEYIHAPQMNEEVSLSIFRDISHIVSSFQSIFNCQLGLSLFQKLLHVIIVTYKLILDLQFIEIWLYLEVVKVMLDFLLLCLAVQGAVNQFRNVRRNIPDIYFSSQLQDPKRTMDILVTHLNLYDLRVRVLGCFDISNGLFLQKASAVVMYLLLVLQCVMELKSIL
ncbi:hypothetical protein KR009_005433, partial [Drosophila setifemur]